MTELDKTDRVSPSELPSIMSKTHTKPNRVLKNLYRLNAGAIPQIMHELSDVTNQDTVTSRDQQQVILSEEQTTVPRIRLDRRLSTSQGCIFPSLVSFNEPVKEPK